MYYNFDHINYNYDINPLKILNFKLLKFNNAKNLIKNLNNLKSPRNKKLKSVNRKINNLFSQNNECFIWKKSDSILKQYNIWHKKFK